MPCDAVAMVTRVSPSQAKNQMGRALDTILDRLPPTNEQIRKYFEAQCAYFGTTLKRDDRNGHIDHVIAGGGNHLGNLVLACSPCNGDGKREMSGLDFLNLNVRDPALYEDRHTKICRWMIMHPAPSQETRAPAVETKIGEIRQLIDDFGKRCAELRALLQQPADEDAG